MTDNLVKIGAMKYKYQNIVRILPAFLLAALVLIACNEDPVLWKLESKDQVATDYINNTEGYSEFSKILQHTGLDHLLRTRGPFTVFVPTDQAMNAFYQANGHSSFEDFQDDEFLKQLMYNHMIANEISVDDVGLGALRDTNAMGDFLVTEFEGADIVINKTATIIDRDVKTANGYIHIINGVLTPLKQSVYDVLASNPSYSLFTEGLELTGLKDTLSIITFPYGDKTARTRFTLLAVADTTFNRYGIQTGEQLVKYFTDATDSLMYLENDFYRFMEYHCLNGTYFLSDIDSRDMLYPILSYDNNVLMSATSDYKINEDPISKKYTGFIVEESNYNAKNGAIHTVNDLLMVSIPPPTTIVFRMTDYFDIRQGDWFENYYMKWSDGENTFEKIKWSGDYLQYYYKPNDRPRFFDDCLNMLGYWWIEIETPKVMKGKYQLEGFIWRGGDMAAFEVFVDGVKVGIIPSAGSDSYLDFGIHEWENTEAHKIKLVSLTSGGLFWETIRFVPVD